MTEPIKFGFTYNLGSTVSSPTSSDIDARPPMLEADQVVDWDPVERWLRHKRPPTVRDYTRYMKLLVEKKGPRLGFNNELGFLEWAKRHKGIAVEEALENFAETLTESQRPPAVAALKTFLERNGYTQLGRMNMEHQTMVWHRGYSRTEIQHLLSFLDDPLEKLYVLFAKDCGLRARTILSLKWHHVKPDYDAVDDKGKPLEYCHLYLEPSYYKGKKLAGITFIGPNTVKALRELVKEGRVHAGSEKCQPEKNRCKCGRIFPFAYTTLVGILNLAKGNSKAKLDSKIQPSHGLRKFFENSLDRLDPPLDVDKKRQLEGHALGSRWAYTEQAVETLRPLYQRAYQFLDLSEDGASNLKMKAVLDELNAMKLEAAGNKDLRTKMDTLEGELMRITRILEELQTGRRGVGGPAPSAERLAA